jgi:hypothetical protein
MAGATDVELANSRLQDFSFAVLIFSVERERSKSPTVLNDPRELAEDLRTDRWEILCNELDQWHDLWIVRKCRLASLLHSMCLYQPLLELIPEDKFVARDLAPGIAQLAFCRASAKFMDDLSKRTSDYDSRTMTAFESLAINDRTPGKVKFNASAMVFVQKANTNASLIELIDWSKRLEGAFAAVADGDERFEAQLFKSRFYRGMGFLPQQAGDKNKLVHTRRQQRINACLNLGQGPNLSGIKSPAKLTS